MWPTLTDWNHIFSETVTEHIMKKKEFLNYRLYFVIYWPAEDNVTIALLKWLKKNKLAHSVYTLHDFIHYRLIYYFCASLFMP